MKKLFIYTAILTASLSLAGCVSNDKPWVKDNSVRSETDQALADCKYQAKAATIGIGQGQQYKSFSNAIAAGINDGIEQATDEKELIADCMRAKGFNQ
jgi:outer membrane lipoprotein SlyB